MKVKYLVEVELDNAGNDHPDIFEKRVEDMKKTFAQRAYILLRLYPLVKDVKISEV